jgi:uncharacterized Rmd1/YagE family protein
VLAKVADTLAFDWARSACLSIVRPLLTTAKRQKQRRLKEEKAHKARIEEQQRMDAKRERRTAKIESLSTTLANHVIRSFVSDEIMRIFESESDVVETVECDVGPRPIAVSGIFFPGRGVTGKQVYETFRGFKFQVDDSGEPKIRFRYNGNRSEILLFLETKDEVRRALAQGSVTCEFGQLQLALAEDLVGETITLYTGQQIMFGTSMRNAERVVVANGMDTAEGNCPLLDLKCFLVRRE